MPRELAQYLGRLLHADRPERSTRAGSSALTCYWHAVFALYWLRENRDVAALARDHGISRTTGYRYLDQVIGVLAEQALNLHEALERAKMERHGRAFARAALRLRLCHLRSCDLLSRASRACRAV